MRLSEELIAIIKDDKPGPDSYSNTALLYLNRQTFEEVKRELVPFGHWAYHVPGVTQMFGIPIMLYHGIPMGEWELVQRVSGENITKGAVWQAEPPRAPQLTDIGLCQNLDHVPYAHTRDNSCVGWQRTEWAE